MAVHCSPRSLRLASASAVRYAIRVVDELCVKDRQYTSVQISIYQTVEMLSIYYEFETSAKLLDLWFFCIVAPNLFGLDSTMDIRGRD